MNGNGFCLSLLATSVIATGALAESTPLNIVPAVQSWKPAAGTFDAAGAAVVVPEMYSRALGPVAQLFRQDLGNPSGTNRSFVLMLDAGDTGRPEGYTVEIGDNVTIHAATATGVFYGTRTLLQMLQQNRVLPRGTISDWPRYKHRMLMLDVGRKPFPMPVLKDYLRILAWYKMNELHLHLSDEAFGGRYTGFRVECETFPGLASRDLFYTKKELREFQNEAKVMGITITPEIDMPGHARVFTQYWPDLQLKGNASYLDVSNPQTTERMEKLLDEMIPIFDAPDFHIGTDEYRVGGPNREKLQEAFRQFINTMNAHIRSRGKNTRIWSGFEHMGGTTDIDPTVTIDMWETDDANAQIAKGHSIINSNQSYTYIVPGAHYYGVSNSGVYNGWEPWMVSGDNTKNPAPDDPHLLGGKLHIWNDQGPTGYTMTEIAALALPSIQAFSEKLWGTKGSSDYAGFQKRAALTQPVPGVTVFDRIPAGTDGVVLSLPGEETLASTDAIIPLRGGRADLEWPWTLTMEVCKTAETNDRGVILSSDLLEICSDFSQSEEIKTKDAAGKEIKTTVTHRGIGVVRAAGSPGLDPASSMKVNQVSRVYSSPSTSNLMRDVSHAYGDALPLNQWVPLTLVGERGHTTLYVNGQRAGDHNDQMVCPLAQLGSKTGHSFVGKVRNLTVINRALTAREIGRAAGLDIPDNLAAHCLATASRSDTPYGLTPEKLTDEDAGTRWSSGPGGAETWVAIDLGKPQEFNTVTINWENAYANEFHIAVSDDGAQWHDIAQGAGKVGVTETRFPPITAQHVRILMSKAATGWGYSIWEVEVLKRK